MAIDNLRRTVKVASRTIQAYSALNRPLERGIRRIIRRENSLDRRHRTAVTDAYYKHRDTAVEPSRPTTSNAEILRLHKHEELAAKYALALLDSERFLGRQSYPHEFKNHDQLPLRHSGPYFEFPLMRGGELFQGEIPGPRRIIFTPEGIVANIVEHCKFAPKKFRLIA